MALPLGYSYRNLAVRRTSTVFTALGIAMTVAVFCGVFSLRNGFQSLYAPRGAEDIAILLRPGANSEGESAIRREQADIILKERPEIARDPGGAAIAAAESYLATYLEKIDGGRTNVPIRGVQPMTFEVLPERPEVIEGRAFRWGTDEVIVGVPISKRIAGCKVGEKIRLNLTEFDVVGIFEAPGVHAGEIWGDVDRMMDALERPVYQRIIARLTPEGSRALLEAERLAAEAEAEATRAARAGSTGATEEGSSAPRSPTFGLVKELEDDPRTPLTIMSERTYLSKQTSFLSAGLLGLAMILTLIMGAAAILGAMNTMLAAVGARTHEIGVLKAIGYRRRAVFAAFLIESAFVGVVGGILGLILVSPFHGIETGATNWNTFTDVSFAFRLDPPTAIAALVIAVSVGILGGVIPAWVASSRPAVEALRSG